MKKKRFSIKTCTLGKKISTLCKTLREGLWKLHSACPEECFEHFSLKKGWFLISFSTLSKIIVDFCQTFTAGFPKLQFTCPEKFFEEKNEKRRFISNFVFWVKKFGTWANKFRHGLPKVHSACPETLLEEIKISGKKNGFLVPLMPWGKICRILSKRFHKFMAEIIAVCFSELHSTCPGDVFEEKTLFENDDFIVIFLPWANKFGHLRGNFYGV